MAINKAGTVKTNLTKNSASGLDAKVCAIDGKAGEMVITDIMVRLLTNNSVVLVFQLLGDMGLIQLIIKIEYNH